MSDLLNRRAMMGTLGAAALAASASAQDTTAKGDLVVLGVACSPRMGKSTATAVQAALAAAEGFHSRIRGKLIDLGGMTVSGWVGGAKPDQPAEVNDDFAKLLGDLKDPRVAGVIIGSPVYFRSMSALCKAFLERLAALRSPKLLWANKPLGALAVGGFRHGGQELVVEQIQTAMLCQEMLIVGGKPKAHQGATLWNSQDDDITKDELGMDTARKLGMHVAEVALEQARPKA
ncbi:MAG: NAD(P)H:quinone oxidoreductase [Planctomycetes bacterium ADurb.Bin126]|nr:MAG: NAD(P)H:quinone oxidoreductase [Planctomycetes bacterium ADurb.Bin126]HOD81896.1 flavodoxin family protein [Phycisphaerae bacterium]HQL74609.1 flavodoxin family protein [Phycisphaerae bacterium]